MKAGRLRHRVTLQRAVDTINDATGGAVRTWVAIGSWRYERAPATVREGLIDGGVMSEADEKWTGRYNSTVAALTAADRAVGTDGRIYNLAGPPVAANGNQQIVLRVRSGLNDGS